MIFVTIHYYYYYKLDPSLLHPLLIELIFDCFLFAYHSGELSVFSSGVCGKSSPSSLLLLLLILVTLPPPAPPLTPPLPLIVSLLVYWRFLLIITTGTLFPFPSRSVVVLDTTGGGEEVVAEDEGEIEVELIFIALH